MSCLSNENTSFMQVNGSLWTIKTLQRCRLILVLWSQDTVCNYRQIAWVISLKSSQGEEILGFDLVHIFWGNLLVAILAVGQVIVKSCMNSNIRTFFLSVPEVKRCWWWVPCHDENGEIFWSKVYQSKLFSQSTNDHHHRHFLSCNTLQHIRNDFRGILISPIDQFFIIHLW